jgi:hypothetical protein
MKVTPTIAKATPMISYGHRSPPVRSGTSLPAAKLTARVVNPVLHQARKVRSFARWVRRVASRASVVIPRNFAAAWATPPEARGLLAARDEPLDQADQKIAKIVAARVLQRLGLSTSAELVHARGTAEAR